MWACTGPFVHFTDTWQLVINTTTIVTFLMVFILNNSQHRDTVAMNAKLDELLKHLEGPTEDLPASNNRPIEASSALENAFVLKPDSMKVSARR